MKLPACLYCERPLTIEEWLHPARDANGDECLCCCECDMEQHYFACCLCREYSHEADKPPLLVVSDPGVPDDIAPGVFRITQYPFCTHALIGSGWLHSNSVVRLADLPAGVDTDGYPCGFVCWECQQRFWPRWRRTAWAIWRGIRAWAWRVRAFGVDDGALICP